MRWNSRRQTAQYCSAGAIHRALACNWGSQATNTYRKILKILSQNLETIPTKFCFLPQEIPAHESESGHVNVRYQYRRTEGKIQETFENYWENAEKPGSCSEATKRVGKLCEFWGGRKGWENPGVVILEAVWDS